MDEKYLKQTELLLQILPSVYETEELAMHGGTAINLFHTDFLRCSTDIDLTYMPIDNRERSLKDINAKLSEIKTRIEKTIPNIKIIHDPSIQKLQCVKNGIPVKIEVNGIKRGIIDKTTELPLCNKARQIFDTLCTARTVPFSQLYGGKISAALNRQHPRDLFDCKYMSISSFDQVRNGVILELISSKKPIVESLSPGLIDQRHVIKSQFEGMTDMPFSYEDYLQTRKNIKQFVNDNLTDNDKQFLLSFEEGTPDWTLCTAGDLSAFPAVQWKLQNINKLKVNNPKKFKEGVNKLSAHIFETPIKKSRDPKL